MEKKKKSLFWIFIKSFTDTNSYKFFLSKNFLRPFLFSLLISLLLSAGLSTFYVLSLNPYADDITQQFKENTPHFVIQDGQLISEALDGTILVETQDKGTLVIIDREYNGSFSQYEEYDTVIVLAIDQIYLSNPNIRYTVNYEAFSTGPVALDSDFLIDFLDNGKTIAFVSLYIFIFAFTIFNYYLYALMIALTVNIVRRFRRQAVHFNISMQLSIYAISFPAILYTFWIGLSSFGLAFVDFLFLALAFIIALKGINAFYAKDGDDSQTKEITKS